MNKARELLYNNQCPVLEHMSRCEKIVVDHHPHIVVGAFPDKRAEDAENVGIVGS